MVATGSTSASPSVSDGMPGSERDARTLVFLSTTTLRPIVVFDVPVPCPAWQIDQTIPTAPALTGSAVQAVVALIRPTVRSFSTEPNHWRRETSRIQVPSHRVPSAVPARIGMRPRPFPRSRHASVPSLACHRSAPNPSRRNGIWSVRHP